VEELMISLLKLVKSQLKLQQACHLLALQFNL
jgi:hypothetical protein